MKFPRSSPCPPHHGQVVGRNWIAAPFGTWLPHLFPCRIARQISLRQWRATNDDPHQEDGLQDSEMIMTTISEVFRSLGQKAAWNGPGQMAHAASRVVTMAPIHSNMDRWAPHPASRWLRKLALLRRTPRALRLMLDLAHAMGACGHFGGNQACHSEASTPAPAPAASSSTYTPPSPLRDRIHDLLPTVPDYTFW
jgi:hypothetical protein